MTGWIRVVGLGPGPSDWITPETSSVLAEATDLVGYHAYVARVPRTNGCRIHSSDNGDELARARTALELARTGSRVAVVSGGDPGVFAMAAAVFEAVESDPILYAELDIRVLPGVTAMLAAAARLGAPLGNDFCTINLSDNLKSWAIIENRLTLATRADLTLALYNPASKARPRQVFDAFDAIRGERSSAAVVVFAKAIGRPDEEIEVTTLGEANPGSADMRTLVLVGSNAMRRIERKEGRCWIYSPRSLASP